MTNIEDQIIDEEETKTVFTVRNMAIGGSVLLLAIGGGALYYMKYHKKEDATAPVKEAEKTAEPAVVAEAEAHPLGDLGHLVELADENGKINIDGILAKREASKAAIEKRAAAKKAAAAEKKAAAAKIANPPIPKNAPSPLPDDMPNLPDDEVVNEHATNQSGSTPEAPKVSKWTKARKAFKSFVKNPRANMLVKPTLANVAAQVVDENAAAEPAPDAETVKDAPPADGTGNDTV